MLYDENGHNKMIEKTDNECIANEINDATAEPPKGSVDIDRDRF